MHMRDPGNAYLKSEKLNFQKKKSFYYLFIQIYFALHIINALYNICMYDIDEFIKRKRN